MTCPSCGGKDWGLERRSYVTGVGPATARTCKGCGLVRVELVNSAKLPVRA